MMAAKILIVDDEQSIVRLVEVTLSKKGYDTITATDGREALAKVDSDHPDLVIMDVMMPHIDGFEAIKILKEKEATRDIPVIMLTAKRHDADLIHGLEAGAVSYLTKPFAPNELVTIVERILAERD